jgi:hypothetical protein
MALCIHVSVAQARQAADAKPQAHTDRVNETLLAGLRPGRDTLTSAEKRYKGRGLVPGEDPRTKDWRDDCSGRTIHLELDAKSVIQSITITTLAPDQSKCAGDRLAEFLDAKNWATGRGLRIGNPQDRVVELYGEPNSSGPATRHGEEMELFFYQFDWAGSDVPQVMEILCARDTGRVMEITLAYPSL